MLFTESELEPEKTSWKTDALKALNDSFIHMGIYTYLTEN